MQNAFYNPMPTGQATPMAPPATTEVQATPLAPPGTTGVQATQTEPATNTVGSNTDPVSVSDPADDELLARVRRLVEPQVPAPPVPTETIQVNPDVVAKETADDISQTRRSMYRGQASLGGRNIDAASTPERMSAMFPNDREVQLTERQQAAVDATHSIWPLISDPPVRVADARDRTELHHPPTNSNTGCRRVNTGSNSKRIKRTIGWGCDGGCGNRRSIRLSSGVGETTKGRG